MTTRHTNKEYELAPNLEEIDEMSMSSCKPKRKYSLRDPKVLKQVEDYNKNAMKNTKTKLEKVMAAEKLRNCKDYHYFILLPDEYPVI